MDPLALLYLMVFLFWVPLLALRSHSALQKGAPLPAKSRLYLQIIIMLAIFGALSIYVGRVYHIPLFGTFNWNWQAAAASVAVMVAMLVTIPLRWRAAPDDVKRRLMLTRPQSADELGWWFLVCAAAGFFEEITYRGVLFSMLWYSTDSPWAAALISATAFAIGHAIQGWRAATVVFFFAWAAQGIVYLAGSLHYAIALHFTYDFLAGLIYIRLAREARQQAREHVLAAEHSMALEGQAVGKVEEKIAEETERILGRSLDSSQR